MEQQQLELNLSDPIAPTMGPQLHELTLGYVGMLRQAETYRRAAAQAVAERDAALREVERLKQANGEPTPIAKAAKG